MKHQMINSALFLVLGLLGVGFTVSQYTDSRRMHVGEAAIYPGQIHANVYQKATNLWLARQDIILFNRALNAYEAGNLTHAAHLFRKALQQGRSEQVRLFALYNLAVTMVDLKERDGAATLFKEALRRNPQDIHAKFNLEQLYQRLHRQSDAFGQAALRAPANELLQPHQRDRYSRS